MTGLPDLKIILLAGGTEVAHSTDHSIWLNTMAAISGLSAPRLSNLKAGTSPSQMDAVDEKGALGVFAAELEVDVNQLIGAASPSTEAPYIHLDHKYWEAIKQNTPPRGVGAIPGVVLAATLLLLWNRHSKFGKISGAMCDAVLATIDHEERNRARSLKGCEWIQVREDGLRLNPASTPSAINLAHAYVTKAVPK